jgi:hypothetical protein
MGDSDSIVNLRDMYNQIVGTRDDVQRLMILMSGTSSRVDDHETRLRRIEDERQDYVSQDDLRDRDEDARERGRRSATIAGLVAAAVSTAVAVAEFVTLHR